MLAFSLTPTFLFAQQAWPAPAATIEAFGDTFSSPLPSPQNQARIYAYRPAKQSNQKPINIYLVGHYHASLLPNGHSAFCVNPGELNIQTVLDDATHSHLGKLQQGLTFTPNNNSTLYLRVEETPTGGSRLQFLPASLALPQIKNTRQQIHTISRSPDAVSCNGAAPAPTPVAKPVPPVPIKAAPRQFNLKADALFYFGKDQLKPSGVKAVNSLIKQLKNEYQSLENIRIYGFTDAIGPEGLNKRLSQKRADTVADMFTSAGVHASRGIAPIGKGSTPLVETHSAPNRPPPTKSARPPTAASWLKLTASANKHPEQT